MTTRNNFTPSQRFGVSSLIALGVTTLTAGAIKERDRATAARHVGAILILGGLIRWAIRPLFIQLRDLYASAHQQGFDQGWHEGRRSARPVVVELDDYRKDSAIHQSDYVCPPNADANG